MNLTHLIAVATGGAIGAAARYMVNVGALRWLGPGFPWGTLAVNVFGSFVMGLIAQWIVERAGLSPGLRLFLMTGVLGGFTTFSAFSLDTVLLAEQGDTGLAALYVAASVTGSIAALIAGQMLVRLALV